MALPNLQPDSRPALRLVDTRKLERAEWLEVRKTGIGASDAVGLPPYKSPLELWLEKTGRKVAFSTARAVSRFASLGTALPLGGST